jgi:quinoprotein relay system zinc metallohydrolase 2
MSHPAHMSRRQALIAGAGMLWSLAATRSRAATHSRASLSAVVTEAVAPGIHIRRGLDEDASAANGDAIANIGFIVGRNAVAVFDPGGSLDDGQRLRARIREVTQLPIRFVVLSHVHPDHIFGAGAFEQDRPEFIGHARLPNALAQRGEYYQRGLESVLGKGKAGPVVVPTRLIVDRGQLDLGDRPLLLTAHPVAHSDCDLSVFDPSSATLLAADLLFVERVPSLDGRLKGWQSALASLKTVAASRAVPGHGPVRVNWPSGARDLDRYLDVLLRETRAAVKRGMEIGDAVASVGSSERGKWKLFDDYQGHNVTQAFKEVEWE